MNEFQKKEIQLLVIERAKQYKSQRQFADSLTNVSEATVIQVIKNNWDKISEAMWRNIGKQVGYSLNGKWNMATTKPFNALIKLLSTAQENALTQAVVVPAGRGKSFAINWFQKHKENVFPVMCTEYWSNKDFLTKILRKMGKDAVGNTDQLMDTIIETVLKLEEPIIILDEFDKLKDRQKLFFITLYNMLSDHCALILIGTANLESQIKNKSTKHRMGFEEIYSRINRRFITLPDSNLKDVALICQANGVDDESEITSIYNECHGDLRRVKTSILKRRIQDGDNNRLKAA